MSTGDAALALQPHHDGSSLYVDPPAPRLGETVRLRLRVPVGLPVSAVGVRVLIDAEARHLPARHDGGAAGASWWSVDVRMANPVVRYRWLVVTGDDAIWVTADGCTRTEPRDADDFVLASDTDVPEWAADAVIYQVFPDRFARSTGAEGRATPDWARPVDWHAPVVHVGPDAGAQLYGGDLDGIAAHLDHLIALGTTVLYLTPFFPARSIHRYDASAFDTVDPLLGGEDALIRLVEAAHRRGIRVIGDLTTNHCGVGHEWFRAAHCRPQAPEGAFFYWLDDVHSEYVSWLGHRSLPKFNWNSTELRRRFIDGAGSVVAKWLREPFLLDGWRIDVANMTGRHASDDLNREVRSTIRRTMRDVAAETLLIAEHTEDAAPDLAGSGWHGAMTYSAFTRPLWAWLMRPGDRPVYADGVAPLPFPERTGEDFVATNRRFTAALPWSARLASVNALDSHDTPRFAGYALPGTVEVAFGLSVALPGIPFVWAGDELGLSAADGEQSRTPMPWDGLHEHDLQIETYTRLTALRRASSALRSGGLRWVGANSDAVAFVRESGDESVLVLATRHAAELRLGGNAINGTPERLVGEATSTGAAESGLTLSAPSASFTAWRLPGVAPPAGTADAPA